MASFGTLAITTALTNEPLPYVITGIGRVQSLSLIATFTRISGGTTVKVYVQHSLDGGSTWYDKKQFAFTTSSLVKDAHISTVFGVTNGTPTTGTMADDDIEQGTLGDQLRVVVTSTGTYGAGSQVKVDYQTH